MRNACITWYTLCKIALWVITCGFCWGLSVNIDCIIKGNNHT